MKFDIPHKKQIMIVLTILVIFSVIVIAAKNMEKNKNSIKDSMGACINDCVHVYNPPTKDAEAIAQYPVAGFMAKICVDACKINAHTLGGCSEEGGDCCNIFREDVDPDCHGEDYCTEQADCQEFYFCDLLDEEPTCKAKLYPPLPCNEDYECRNEVCTIDPVTKEGFC